MKSYISKLTNSSGAYGNLILQPFAGSIELSDSQTELYLKYNGFVRITGTDPVTIEPDTAAWQAWKAAEAEKPPVVEAPTIEERTAALESAMLSMMGVSLNV